jgi:glycosyltransferase involved in cell wall biosynthesis
VEALQHGVPTVATRVGAEGIDEAAVQALVVSDDPVVLAEAIAQLVDEPAAWARRRKRIEAASGHWTGGRRGVTWPDILA